MSKEKQFEKFKIELEKVFWEAIRRNFRPQKDGSLIMIADLVNSIEQYILLQERRIVHLENQQEELLDEIAELKSKLECTKNTEVVVEIKISEQTLNDSIMAFHRMVNGLLPEEKTQKKAKLSEKTKAKCECEKKNCKKGGTE
jgi:KaiC/GvpD/RAD55 family RecA-like ATPase